MASLATNSPRPFLKWVGGKTQLLPQLLQSLDKAGHFGAYHEPFLGGGALFFALSDLLARRKAYVTDFNSNLVEAYLGLMQDVEKVISLLKAHKINHSKEYYYEVRASVPTNMLARAARIIYLNKTCYNGLYRENSRGLFNVPIGSYINPTICDEENLLRCAVALRRAHVEARSFETVLDKAKADDLVYFDPPYHPVSRTSSFTAYEKNGFGETKQWQLSEVFSELDKRNVRVMLSNSDAPLIRKLYKNWRLIQVMAKRSVNSRADGRGHIPELLVQNF